MNIEIIKLNIKDKKEISQVANIWFRWWGKDCKLKIPELKQIVKNRCSGKIIPITYIAKINNKVIGTISFVDNDTELRTDLYPMIACVYVKEEYRNKGIATKLMKSILDDISPHFDFVYLTTLLDGFYEKFAFKFVEIADVNIIKGIPHREKIYKLEIKDMK